MNRLLPLLFLIVSITSAADSPFTYKGACMVYSDIAGKVKTLANMNVELSKASKVLYQKNGYSFAVEQIDNVYTDDNNRVEHTLNVRVMKNSKIVTWATAEIGDSKDSGMILMSGSLPVISCSRGE